jgi:hypothetical protein
MSINFGNGYYRSARYYGLSRKRQIIDLTLDELHEMQMSMIEDVVTAKESQGFPEANLVINHVRTL